MYYYQQYDNPAVQQNPRIPATCPAGSRRYTVVRGDTIYRIAQRFGIDVNTLIAANPHIPNPNILFVGDVLCIPRAINGECPPETEQYIVQPGDTLIRIAQRFGVSLEELIEANPQIENPNLLFPGDIVCIPIVRRPLLPCCIYLSVRELDTRGSALFEAFRRLGQFSVGILVKDPPPADQFGNYNAYRAEILVPGIDSFETDLNPVVNEPTLAAGRLIFQLPEGIFELPIETRVFVRPFNRNTGEIGPAILQGSLQQCRDF